MFHLVMIVVLVLAGVWYGEKHDLIKPGGIIPDLRGIHLPDIRFPDVSGASSDHTSYWKKG